MKIIVNKKRKRIKKKKEGMGAGVGEYILRVYKRIRGNIQF
jgi:hypothetical protein